MRRVGSVKMMESQNFSWTHPLSLASLPMAPLLLTGSSARGPR